MAKKVHWTQRPENRARVKAQMERANARRATRDEKKRLADAPLLGELEELRRRAKERLDAIVQQMKILDDERRALLNAFPEHRAEEDR